MNLEDNLGDVISKARVAAAVPVEAVAAVSGLEDSDYAKLEETGQFSKKPDLRAIATKVGLHGVKLEGIAEGWLPQKRELGRWRELRQITTAGSNFKVNCYLVWDEATREAALFDTGFDERPILDLIDQHQLQLKHLFITHTHSDHVAALEPIRRKHAKVKLHSNAKAAPVDQ